MKMVEFAGQVGWVGKIVKVKIEKVEMWRLIGQIVQELTNMQLLPQIKRSLNLRQW